MTTLPAQLQGLATHLDPAIKALTSSCPSLKVLTPTDPDWPIVRETFISTSSVIPLAIVRPASGAEVAQIVKFAISHDVPFTIRAGGHELYGRNVEAGALMIDLREIKHVRVSEDRSCAFVGTGIACSALATELSKEELITPFSVIPSVGLGWSMIGGYSFIVSKYGLGCDQIIGAKIVNAQGDEVEASPDVLYGIRGAQGGPFGIVTELKLKVYPFTTMTAGTLFFAPTPTVSSTASAFLHGLTQIEPSFPPDLHVEPICVTAPIPELTKLFGCFFVYASSDAESAKPWLDKVSACAGAPVVMNTVAPMTAAEFAQSQAALLSFGYHGAARTVTIPAFTPKTIEVTAAHLEKSPLNPVTMWLAHRLRGGTVSTRPEVAEGSCFGCREAHWMFEIVPLVGEGQDGTQEEEWARGFERDMRGTGECLEWTYHALTHPESNSLENQFGKHWQKLMELKREIDPENVFRTAQPDLSAAYGKRLNDKSDGP